MQNTKKKKSRNDANATTDVVEMANSPEREPKAVSLLVAY